MSILREELITFVNVHNAHLIRAQKNRAQYLAGVPDELYRSGPGQQQEFKPCQEVLAALKSVIPVYDLSLNMLKLAVNYG
jgi:hypothetical protein